MWSNPVKNTPSIVQVDFGAWGQNMPGDGESYCAPTSLVMGLYYLYNNGFTQLASAAFTNQNDPDTINLERIIAGLMETSSEAGTSVAESGIEAYLSACGIAPSQYTYKSSDNPDLQWLATQLAANVAEDPDAIVLADFSVGWYVTDDNNPESLLNVGGHTLCPLTVDLDSVALTLNNAYPASFENVPNDPACNPQTVILSRLPDGLTLQYLPGPSGQYSQVISGNKGNGTDWAILWLAGAWAISSWARPTAPGYTPSTWQIDHLQTINTNGATFTVLAPLAGSGSLWKCGPGKLVLTSTNQLNGALTVSGGALTTTQTSGTPLGTGPITLASGGALALSDSSSSVKLQIASGSGATLTLGAGDGALQLGGANPSVVTIGGNSDGSTANLVRLAYGTLRLQPNLGVAGLGTDQQVVVAGSDANLPAVSNGIVAPWILGQDNDSGGSGVFLTYGSSGFTPADTVSSSDTNINDVTADTVYRVVDTQTIDDGATVQLAALELEGGAIDGGSATLQVGSQSATDIAGVIMNGGQINAGTLAFGAAEAVFYAGNSENQIVNATLSGTGGLTLTGPGPITLAADNAASLSGTINVNSGTLGIGGNGASGSGAVTVHTGATLAVVGTVAGAVTVGQSAVLSLGGGTVQGDVSIAAIGTSTSEPGGILQGAGTFNGVVLAAGSIRSAFGGGVLVFANEVSLPGNSAFYWTLQGFVDNTTSPTVAWNALQIDQQSIYIGTEEDQTSLSIFLDFSVLGGDPDSGDPFWSNPRQWTIMTFATDAWYGLWSVENGTYATGDFSTSWDKTNPLALYLDWTPVPAKRSPAARLAVQARVRPTAKRRPA